MPSDEQTKFSWVKCRSCDGNGKYPDGRECGICYGKGIRLAPEVKWEPEVRMSPLLTTCPQCGGSKFIGSIPCVECGGTGTVPIDATHKITPIGSGGIVINPPDPSMPKWLQALLTILGAIAALAGAYSSWQSSKNHEAIRAVHQRQDENAAKIDDVHKEVKATRQAIHKD